MNWQTWQTPRDRHTTRASVCSPSFKGDVRFNTEGDDRHVLRQFYNIAPGYPAESCATTHPPRRPFILDVTSNRKGDVAARASPSKRLVLWRWRGTIEIYYAGATIFFKAVGKRRFPAFSGSSELLLLRRTLRYLQTSYLVILTLYQGYFNVVRLRMVPYGYTE